MIGSVNRRERIIVRTWYIIAGAALSLGAAAVAALVYVVGRWIFAG